LDIQYERLLKACHVLDCERQDFNSIDVIILQLVTRKHDIFLKRLDLLFIDTRVLGTSLINKKSILLIDFVILRNVFNNPYNAFHPIYFSWSLENDELDVPYLLCIVVSFLQRLKDSRLHVFQFWALNDRVGWGCIFLGNAQQTELQ
jgi:hypothetical protein